jgi:hypothetical protein
MRHSSRDLAAKKVEDKVLRETKVNCHEDRVAQ